MSNRRGVCIAELLERRALLAGGPSYFESPADFVAYSAVPDRSREALYIHDSLRGRLLAVDTTTMTTVTRANLRGIAGRMDTSLAGDKLFVGETGDTSTSGIEVFALPQLQRIALFKFTTGFGDLAVGANNKIYVATQFTRQVWQIDATTGRKLATIGTFGEDCVIETTRDGSHLYIMERRGGATSGGSSVIYDYDSSGTGRPTLAATRTFDGDRALDFAIDEQHHRAYVLTNSPTSISFTQLDRDSHSTLSTNDHLATAIGIPRGSSEVFVAMENSKKHLIRGYNRSSGSVDFDLPISARVAPARLIDANKQQVLFSSFTNNNGRYSMTAGLIGGGNTLNIENDPPVAKFKTQPLSSRQIRFDGTASSTVSKTQSITTYRWNFGDGKAATGSLVSHTFASAGDYRVKLTVTSSIGLPSKPLVSTVHVGATTNTASITGRLFEDDNFNRKRDSNEKWIRDCGVYLDANNNGKPEPGERHVATAGDGSYGFLNLSAGTYHVLPFVPDGWLHTGKPAEVTVTLVDGQGAGGVDFGMAPGGWIIGHVGDDVNDDGFTGSSAELDVADTHAVWLDLNDNNAIDRGEPTTRSVGGEYKFSALKPGTYVVREQIPAGEVMRQPAEGAYRVTVRLNRLTSVAGFITAPPPKGQISGTIFNDRNGDFFRGTDEPGLAKRTVFIDANGNRQLDENERTTRTDSAGRYTFKELTQGSYDIAQVNPSGWRNSLSQQVSLARNERRTGVDFASTNSIVLVGFVRDQATQAAVPDVSIYIDANNNKRLDSGERATRSIYNGVFFLVVPDPGTYTVRIASAPGSQVIAPADGFHRVTVTAGEEKKNLNFSIRP